jgi:hypothetical protein
LQRTKFLSFAFENNEADENKFSVVPITKPTHDTRFEASLFTPFLRKFSIVKLENIRFVRLRLFKKLMQATVITG